MFWVLKQLCAQGGSLYAMEARWLKLKTNNDSHQFFTYKPQDPTDKVHQGRLGNMPLNPLNWPIYDNPKDHSMCPMTNLLEYLSKQPSAALPPNPFLQHHTNSMLVHTTEGGSKEVPCTLWLHINSTGIPRPGTAWYKKQHIGEGTLETTLGKNCHELGIGTHQRRDGS